MHFREPVISAKPKFGTNSCIAVWLLVLSGYNIITLKCLRNVPITLLSVYCHVIMLSVFNKLCQSGLWIVLWEVSQEGIYMYHFDFFPWQIDMETKKQTENLLMVNVVIPNAYKKWSRNGKIQVFKKLYYWLLWIYDYQYWKICWH